MIVLVMGVSGSGKSAFGRMLAERLGFVFVEGDDFHSPDNREKMRAGTALTDADREPWLDALAGKIERLASRKRSAVLACSALKKRYRERLRGAAGVMRLIYLRGERNLIASRLSARRGHFMAPSLLDSQFEALEEPEPAEAALMLDIGRAPEMLVDEAARWLREDLSPPRLNR
ncbi:MAG TPA: gluconokinase [Beijerinckiaceae bacterium]|nr:gluconokinase [Beijerinckiaceae bacterium]